MSNRRRGLFKLGLVGRPQASSYQAISTSNMRNSVILDRVQDVNLIELYSLSERCNAVSKSIQALQDYLFKSGYEWKPKYSKKCKLCKYEHPPEMAVENCIRCQSTQLVSPDPQEYVDAHKFFRRVDINGHTLTESLKMFERHLNIADDAFLIIAKDYEVDDAGEITGWDVRELFVPSPLNFKMVINPRTQRPGGMFYICLKHRPVNEDERDALHLGPTDVGEVYKEPGNCDLCGGKLYDVWYVSTETTSQGNVYGGETDQIIEYFIGDTVLQDGSICKEVIHESKYSNTYGYGMSPIIPIFSMAKTLVKMEEYVRTFYEEERTPRGALFIPSNNSEGVRAAWAEAEHRNVSQKGTYIPKFTFDPGASGGSRPVQYIEFSKLPNELEMTETSDYYYRRIGSAFGIAPVFHGNVDAVGLQQQGPTQWQVTVLAAQIGQQIYNDKVLPHIAEQLGVANWELVLVEVEEKDIAQEYQIKLMKLQEAQQMAALGYAPTGRDVQGDFIYPNQQTQMDASQMPQDGSMPGTPGPAPMPNMPSPQNLNEQGGGVSPDSF